MPDTKYELTHDERVRQLVARYIRSMEVGEPRSQAELTEITAVLNEIKKG